MFFFFKISAHHVMAWVYEFLVKDRDFLEQK